MFPRMTAPRLRARITAAADALLEVADAMLMPEDAREAAIVDAQTARSAAGVPTLFDDAILDWEIHPHRRPLRSDRERRPGQLPARPQHCTVPARADDQHRDDRTTPVAGA